MKKIILTLMLILTTTVFSVEDTGIGALLGLGTMETDGDTETVIKLKLTPKLKLGALGVGFNLTTYANTSFEIVDADEDGSDYDIEFRYIYWDGDLIKFNYGIFDDFDLGTGSIINNYSNNEKRSFRFGLHHPEKKYGADVFYPLAKDLIASEDIPKEERPSLYGGSVYVRPLRVFDIPIPVINDLQIGVTYAADNKDKFFKITGGAFEILSGSAVEYDGEVTAISYDIELPLIEGFIVPYYSLATVSGEFSEKSENGSGHFAGVRGKLTTFEYRVEYRNVTQNMRPGYFGRFYETKSNEYLDQIINTTDDRVSGFFGEAGFDVFGLIQMSASYEDYDSDDLEPKIYGKVDFEPSDKFKINITYEQENFGSDDHSDEWLNEDTYLKAHVLVPSALVGVPGPFVVAADIEQTYEFNEEVDAYEARREYTVSFGLEF